MPASEAELKPYWIFENRECKDRVTTVNDVPVAETGHNLHAPSQQEAEPRSKNPCLQNCTLQLEVIKKNSTGSNSTEIRRISA